MIETQAQPKSSVCHAILLIEDDPDIREILKQTLELEGYTVHTATNGKDGFDTLELIPRPCLILLDLMMPVMTGWEFLNQRSDDVMIASIPVVVVSSVGEQARSVSHGVSRVQGYIKKPVDLDTLLRVVKAYCG